MNGKNRSTRERPNSRAIVICHHSSKHCRHSTHHNRNRISTFSCTAVEPLVCGFVKGDYPENSHMFCIVIFRFAFLLTVYVFGSCFMTLAFILVSDILLSTDFQNWLLCQHQLGRTCNKNKQWCCRRSTLGRVHSVGTDLMTEKTKLTSCETIVPVSSED